MGMGLLNDPAIWQLIGTRLMDGLGAVGAFLTNACWHVFLTHVLPRPETKALSRTFETTPSSPTLQACWYISWPSILKLSLNWTLVHRPRQRMTHNDDLIEPEAKQILLAHSRPSRGRNSPSPKPQEERESTNQVCKVSPFA